MTIYIGADHRGFQLKEKLKPWLASQGYAVVDCGNTIYDKGDDYPDFSFAVAEAVAQNPPCFGIMICGSAGGGTIAANKIRGIRAVTAVAEGDVFHNRDHNDANILILAADTTDEEKARNLTEIFLKTSFLGEERLVRRLNKIKEKESVT